MSVAVVAALPVTATRIAAFSFAVLAAGTESAGVVAAIWMSVVMLVCVLDPAAPVLNTSASITHATAADVENAPVVAIVVPPVPTVEPTTAVDGLKISLTVLVLALLANEP